MIQEIDFNHCPKCSGTFQKQSENVLECTECFFHYYVSPKPCNAVIIENDEGEILLVKRKREPQKGWWDLPGGFIDLDETAEESVQREAMEELNISLKNIRYFASSPDVYHYEGIEYNTICFIFTADIADGELKASDDVSEFAFVAKDTIDIEGIAFEGLRQALSNYLKRNK